MGIGRVLMEASIDCARQAGYTQLELEVVADNERAVSLYRCAGFEEYGRNPRGYRSADAGYQELVHAQLKEEGVLERQGSPRSGVWVVRAPRL